MITIICSLKLPQAGWFFSNKFPFDIQTKHKMFNLFPLLSPMNTPGYLFLAINLEITSNNISEDSKGANSRWVFRVAGDVKMSI